MKTVFLTFSLILCTLFCLAQAPQGFNYQAVIRDASSNIISNQSIGLQMALLQGASNGTSVYTETFSSDTDDNGVVNAVIGSGTTTDDMSAIDWANGPYFLQVAVDLSNGTNYMVIDAFQLMSVPYALYASSTSNANSSSNTGSPCNSHIFPSMTINASGFISWFKVTTVPYDWVGLSTPNTTNNTITLDIIAGGTVYLDALTYSMSTASVLTISEAALVTAIGNPTSTIDVGVRIKSDFPAATYVRGEKKTNDGRLQILGECFD